jgi:hypothetical protein
VLGTLDPKARDTFRRVLIRDQADRDAIASHLMRYRDQTGDDWADIIDFLTMWPEKFTRLSLVEPKPTRAHSQPAESDQGTRRSKPRL